MNLQGNEPLSKNAVRILRTKGLLSGTIPIIIMGVILFLSAGTLNWSMAWVIICVMFAATTFVTLVCSPDLIIERMHKQKGEKDWDARLVRAMNLVGLLPLLTAGLSLRFGWIGQVPVIVETAALCFFLLGYGIFVRAMLVNRFFSRVVRIQQEKDHRAVTTGPYRFVRHPGYLGFILIVLAQPLMLGSFWALIPGVLTAGLFVVRTRREDAALYRELPGYPEYARDVRYRLFPGIW
ncbi:MAG: isoprenylcysteine carboxylmethyltransferase family protein [Smithellaceae bacterium]|jgi:protein-S-isoprenylcysteine O-methyltransferase Ste14